MAEQRCSGQFWTSLPPRPYPETVAEYLPAKVSVMRKCGRIRRRVSEKRQAQQPAWSIAVCCLDADNADPGLMDDLDMTFINAYALYST